MFNQVQQNFLYFKMVVAQYITHDYTSDKNLNQMTFHNESGCHQASIE